MRGLIGKKVGMTQMFDDREELIPITVVEAGPCPIVQIKSKERDGYDAIQLGYAEIPARKANKPMAGVFEKAGVKPQRMLKEFRMKNGETYKIGQALDVSLFQVGDQIDVTGKSKGRGFAGVVRRYNFKGAPKSHGTPDRVRAPGAIGQCATPSRVFKGKKMPGRMGNERVTVKNLSVIRVDKDRNLLFLRGCVPGPKNGYLLIRGA